ncbi:MAG: endolytic transglycosylase MltG [Dysgonamonadaceae bacterium]|nr:endolytic transglycosylase MltG [Dysgonamonadaceae bacterium]
MKRKTNRIYISIILIIIVLGGISGYFYYRLIYPGFAIKEPVSVYIGKEKDYDALLSDLETVANIKDLAFFKKIASHTHYKDHMRTGRYVITPSMSYPDAIKMFRNGQQTPVKIMFNNVRLKTDFAEKVGSQLMFDTESLLEKINDPTLCESFGFDTITIVNMFIPNTYEMYWNISATKFLERMKKEYDRFWTPERLEKAKAIPLTPVQVAVLASIVEEETAKKSDYSMVAGLYINRLRKKMLLQADPTVKFAVGDFSLRRILYAHLNVDSPYNTYKYPGLPPGPIRFPSISGIDAVLNYTRHNYLYMTAKEDLSGETNFAVTHVEHIRNAKKYQAALNRYNIR